MDLSASRLRPVIQAAGGNVASIPYTDARIQYQGRWIDSGTGMWSGWPSAQCIFKVAGVTALNIIAHLTDANTNGRGVVQYSIDNADNDLSQYGLTTQAQIFTGLVVIQIVIPDTGEHTVLIDFAGWYTLQYAGTNRLEIREIQINSSGTLSAWTQGSVNLQTIGDSWTAAYNGWTRLLDRAHFKINSVAVPGFKASDLKPQYKYDYSGHVNTSDPAFAGIVVMFGVNEYLAGVTTATFKTDMLALVDEIRLRQAAPIPIVLVALPDNTNAGKLYSTYKTVLTEITAMRAQTYVCDLSTLSASLANFWLADGTDGHLDYRGKPIVAAYLDGYLKTTIGI